MYRRLPDEPDQAEENKKARENTLQSLATFVMTIGLINLGTHFLNSNLTLLKKTFFLVAMYLESEWILRCFVQNIISFM